MRKWQMLKKQLQDRCRCRWWALKLLWQIFNYSRIKKTIQYSIKTIWHIYKTIERRNRKHWSHLHTCRLVISHQLYILHFSISKQVRDLKRGDIGKFQEFTNQILKTPEYCIANENVSYIKPIKCSFVLLNYVKWK